MNLSKIKQFVKQNGDKFIVVENDEPEIVVMSFEEYVKLTGAAEADKKKVSAVSKEPEAKTIVDADDSLRETEFIDSPVLEIGGFRRHAEDIRLEDLPL